MAVETLVLRMIRRSEIPRNKPLPGAIRNHEGTALLCAGRVFDEAAAAQLGTHVPYVGPDWPPLESENDEHQPDEVIEALADQRGEVAICQNRRAHVRHKWTIHLNVHVKEPFQNSVTKMVSVVTKEISCGGFSFLYSQYLPPGTLVLATFEILPHKPMLRGIVRTSILQKGGQHRVGVQFQKVMK